MKRFTAFILVTLLVFPLHASELSTLPARITTKTKKMTLILEVADTPAERSHGLMERIDLAPYDGMLFLFPNVAIQKFWMKNTRIPLDVLFVDRSGRIIQITQAKAMSEEPFGPDTPVASVIELAGGRAKKEGIIVGDRVDYGVATEQKNPAH